jgi:hypothetical protein
MREKSKILTVAIPLMILLSGAIFYEYGYLGVQTELKDLEESASSKSKILMKYRNLIARKPYLEDRLATLKETLKADRAKMIEGQTPSLAAAALQSTLTGMITARGGTIASERAEKPEDAGKFRTITVTIDAVLPDTRALSDTLYAIETQTPHLVVRELDVRIRNYKDPRDLSVKLRVSGLTGGV